jgi:hypothetical protein
LRTDDGTAIRVNAAVGVVYFDDAPMGVAVVAAIPADWEVVEFHDQPRAVNVWVASRGARVRISGGRRVGEEILGDATDAVEVLVIRAA